MQAAGYSSDVTVTEEYAESLPSHLSVFSEHLGRSYVSLATVTTSVADPKLRRSIMFQGLRVFISVTSLGSKFGQRQAQAKAASASAKQSRKKVNKVFFGL